MALANELGIPLVGRQVDGQGHDLQVDLDKLQWDSHKIVKVIYYSKYFTLSDLNQIGVSFLQ